MWNDTIIESVRGCTRPELDLGALNLGRHPLGSVELARAAIESLISDIKYRSIEERVGITEQIASLAGVRPPEDLMMTSQEVKSMRQSGMQIGAHTISHPILARLGDETARQEIQGSKNFLEQLLEERVALFAYPNGKPGEDYTAHSVDIVRGLGFDAAVSTRWGSSAHGDDLFEIRRFTPWDQSRLRFGLRLISNLRKSHAGKPKEA